MVHLVISIKSRYTYANTYGNYNFAELTPTRRISIYNLARFKGLFVIGFNRPNVCRIVKSFLKQLTMVVRHLLLYRYWWLRGLCFHLILNEWIHYICTRLTITRWQLYIIRFWKYYVTLYLRVHGRSRMCLNP